MVKKNCIVCGNEFVKTPKISIKQWLSRMYCSMNCKNRNEGNLRKRPIEERFWRFVSKGDDNECWEWNGSGDGHGYGTISIGPGKSPEKAHRLSYIIHKGEIEIGMVIRHECDNPSCVNPNHLIMGTQKDNMQDASKRNRLNERSFDNLNHDKKLTSTQVQEIKGIKFKSRNGRGDGELMSDVAENYGVCCHTIRKIKQNNY